MKVTDYHGMPWWERVAAARQHGIRLLVVPGRPSQVLLYGQRGNDPEVEGIVHALRECADELAMVLARPYPLADGEDAYRRDVLHEPDVLVGELPWSVLAAMIISLVRDTMESVEAEREWLASVVRGDDPRPASERRTRTVRVA
jgi:hypothetical protein